MCCAAAGLDPAKRHVTYQHVDDASAGIRRIERVLPTIGCQPCLEVEDQGKSTVDPLHLIDAQEADRLVEAVEIYSGDLIAHDHRLAVPDGHQWTEAGCAGAGAGEGDDPGAQGQSIRLQDDGVTATLLLVSFPSSWESVNLTPHAAPRSPAVLPEFRIDHPGRL